MNMNYKNGIYRKPTKIATVRADRVPLARGEVTGIFLFGKFAGAPSFDIADGDVLIWDGSDKNGIDQMSYTYTTGATIDTISSSSVDDSQEVIIFGLDENKDLVEQTIVLNGQTKVLLETPLYRVYRMYNNGSTDFNGEIYCYEDTVITAGVPNDKSKIKAMINLNNNQTLMGVFTIPRGYTGYITRLRAGGASSSSNFFGATPSASTIKVFTRALGKVFRLRYNDVVTSFGNSTINVELYPIKCEEGTDIEIRCDTTVDGSSVACGFEIELVKIKNGAGQI